MDTLTYIFYGFLIGWSVGGIALLVGMGVYGAWHALLEWIGDMRWRFGWWRTQRRWKRDGVPDGAKTAVQHMAAMTAGMATMQEVADALAKMNGK